MMLGLLLAAAALAPTAPDCAESQEAMNRCAEQDFTRADRALDRQWQTLVAAARRNDTNEDVPHPPAFPMLLKAQRAWLAYRDESCGWVQRAYPGSISTVNYLVCMTRMTKARTIELQLLLLDPNE